MNNVKKEKYRTKCFLIGAGFDMMFNLPSWTELVDSFSSFVKANADFERNKAVAKINIIKSMSNSPSRHMQSIKNEADKHITDKSQVTTFMKNILDIRKYVHDDTLFLKAAEIIRITSDLIISTNTSNVFKLMGVQEAYSSSEMSNGSYYPIHGTYFSDEVVKKPVMFEEDYLDTVDYKSRMKKLSEMLINKNVIHIFGYSLNDIEILTKIKETTSIDVIYYFNYEDENWKEIIEGQFRSLFGEGRITFISDEKTEVGYSSNFNRLLECFEKTDDDDSLFDAVESLEDINE